MSTISEVLPNKLVELLNLLTKGAEILPSTIKVKSKARTILINLVLSFG